MPCEKTGAAVVVMNRMLRRDVRVRIRRSVRCRPDLSGCVSSGRERRIVPVPGVSGSEENGRQAGEAGDCRKSCRFGGTGASEARFRYGCIAEEFPSKYKNREKAGLCAAFPGGGRKRIPTRSGCGQSVRTKRSGGGTGKVEWGPGADRAVRKRTTDGREPVVGKVAASAGRDGVERVQGTGEEGSEAETFRKRIIFLIFTDAPCRARVSSGALT